MCVVRPRHLQIVRARPQVDRGAGAASWACSRAQNGFTGGARGVLALVSQRSGLLRPFLKEQAEPGLGALGNKKRTVTRIQNRAARELLRELLISALARRPEGRRKSGNRHRDSTDLRVKRSAASDTFRRRSPSRVSEYRVRMRPCLLTPLRAPSGSRSAGLSKLTHRLANAPVHGRSRSNSNLKHHAHLLPGALPWVCGRRRARRPLPVFFRARRSHLVLHCSGSVFSLASLEESSTSEVH